MQSTSKRNDFAKWLMDAHGSSPWAEGPRAKPGQDDDGGESTWSDRAPGFASKADEINLRPVKKKVLRDPANRFRLASV